jgi:hypothetical protein
LQQRRPAQSLERQFDLPHPLRRGHLQRGPGGAAEHPIVVQAVAALKAAQCGVGRRAFGSVAQGRQAFVQQRIAGPGCVCIGLLRGP